MIRRFAVTTALLTALAGAGIGTAHAGQIIAEFATEAECLHAGHTWGVGQLGVTVFCGYDPNRGWFLYTR